MIYRIMAVKYGYIEVDVPDNDDRKALIKAENAADDQYEWTKPYSHKIVETFTAEETAQTKKVVRISGADLGIKKGEPAMVYNMDGQILKTSPVVAYTIAGSQIYIETMHTIYRTFKDEEV